MAYNNIREEALKNKVAKDFFNVFDCTKRASSFKDSIK
jgi:hypothetical protein